MIRYFAAHPTAANIVMLAIIAIGLATLPFLNKETFPEIQGDQVKVTVAYPGASPVDVEEGICRPLEEAMEDVSYLKEQRCIAIDNLGSMVVVMQEQGTMQSFMDDIKSVVDAIDHFPEASELPIVEELGRTDLVVSLAITAPITKTELKALAEHYRLALLKLSAVSIVKVKGFTAQQLKISVSPEQLHAYQLSIEDVAHLIHQQATDLPTGTIESRDAKYQIRFENQRRTVAEMGDLVILNTQAGGVVRLRDFATIEVGFADSGRRVEIDGQAAAVLDIHKNSTEDTLEIFHQVDQFVQQENQRLPPSTQLIITQDNASIVQDRLSLLMKNGLQGLVLAGLVLFIFFNARYTFWIILGLPVSFLGGLVVMSVLGVTINMISMIALLMAIGILMDDAMVISESVAVHYRQAKIQFLASRIGNGDGQNHQMPFELVVDAVVSGVKQVYGGVLASFLTSAMLFGSLFMLTGEVGQIMKVLPIVLLAVLTISLVEAFLILPSHLSHSLYKMKNPKAWRVLVERSFDTVRNTLGRWVESAIRYQYCVVGLAIALLIISVSFFSSGILKFTFFPTLEGNILEARILMPQGTRTNETEKIVVALLKTLQQSVKKMPEETQGELVQHIRVNFGENLDAGTEGSHVATISLDLLNAEKRVGSVNQLRQLWLETSQSQPSIMADAIAIQFKEPAIGPGGHAIEFRLQGDDLDALSSASGALQEWLQRYQGVFNLMDDLHPSKQQLIVRPQAGYLNASADASRVAGQIRSAYEGKKVMDIYHQGDPYEVVVKLDTKNEDALEQFYQLPIMTAVSEMVPLSSIMTISSRRGYARISRMNQSRTVSVLGDVDTAVANTQEIMDHTWAHYMPKLKAQYPSIDVAIEGEVKSSEETNRSVIQGFVLAIFGVYLLLALQFGNYREPVVVLMNVPLAFIGVIWGHLLMGLNFTMPSMIGFVALAGVVVNDSILLVGLMKRYQHTDQSFSVAAGRAVSDRFRAIFLTSITTVAGLFPMLLEESLQAQVLVPLVCSVVFGMLASTVLILFVLPCAYAIVCQNR